MEEEKNEEVADQPTSTAKSFNSNQLMPSYPLRHAWELCRQKFCRQGRVVRATGSVMLHACKGDYTTGGVYNPPRLQKFLLQKSHPGMNGVYNLFTSTPYLGYYGQLPPLANIYSPFASRYGARYEGSTHGYAMDRSMGQFSPPPHLTPFSTPLVINTDSKLSIKMSLTSSFQNDSGIASSSSFSSESSMIRQVVRGYKKTYCAICKMHINKDGKRSQGPRRHLLQYHVRRPLFQCPHCSHASFYDKFHVTSHMRRIHQDHTEKLVNRSAEFEEEVALWYERCFGDAKSLVYPDSKEVSQRSQRLSVSMSSPPPVLTPEGVDQENVDPSCAVEAKDLPETPLRAPLKRRKTGFMVEDLLQLSPEKPVFLKRPH